MARFALIIVVIFLSIAISKGHTDPISNYTKATTANTDSTPQSIIKSSDGQYFIAGNSYSHEKKASSFWIWKVNSDGEIIWDKRIESHYQDKVTALISTPDGGVLALGHIFVYEPQTGYRCWIKHFDKNGEITFAKTIDGYGWAGILLRTTDGNYLFAGTTDRTDSKRKDNYDAWLVKFNATGNILWNKLYDKGFDEAVFSGVNIEDDGFLFAATSGKQNKFGQGNSEGWVTKYNSAGELLTETKIPDCRAMSSGVYIAKKAEEFAVICSTSQLPPIDKVPLMLPSFGARIIIFNYKLKELSRLNIGGYSSILSPMIATSDDGNYLVAGAVEKGIKVEKFVPSGKRVWGKIAEYNQKGHFHFNVRGLVTDGEFAYIVGDISELKIDGTEQVFFLKINTAAGNILTLKKY